MKGELDGSLKHELYQWGKNLATLGKSEATATKGFKWLASFVNEIDTPACRKIFLDGFRSGPAESGEVVTVPTLTDWLILFSQNPQ